MAARQPNDVLMQNILAEAYLKSGDCSRATKILNDAFEKVIGEQKIALIDETPHPAWCNDCSKQVRGVRTLCIQCLDHDYECCIYCLKEERGNPHPCRDHPLVIIPSWARLEL